VRPKTIVYFEWIIFGTILLNALHVYLSWDAQAAAAYPDATLAIIIILIFTFVLNGTLTLLVSRRRSKVAMWVLIALFALSVPFVVVQWTRQPLGSDIITPVHVIGVLVAYRLLFTPSARRWMSRKDEKLREVFE
jgi:putative flippase GtrA